MEEQDKKEPKKKRRLVKPFEFITKGLEYIGKKITQGTEYIIEFGLAHARAVVGFIVIIIVFMYIYSGIQSSVIYDQMEKKKFVNNAEILLNKNYKPSIDSNSIRHLDSMEMYVKDSINCDCPNSYKDDELFIKQKQLQRIQTKKD